MENSCTCGSCKAFEECCGRFLSGALAAKTPEQLMRSRYSAYALGNYGEYLLSTWFPATARGLSVEILSERSRQWTKLEVITKSQSGDTGSVEFKAWYRSQDGSEEAMHEKSVFQRIQGRWLYVGGEVSNE